MAQVATGTTITRSGFAYNVVSVEGPGLAVEKINANHLGTTGYFKYIFGTLIDPGDLTLEVEHTGVYPTLGGAAVLTTVTEPGGKYVRGDAVITGYSPSRTVEEKEMASMTISFNGENIAFGG